MEKIKLVIWDMDETFWKGTISEGDVFPIQENIDLIKKLTDRGIVNSICSKNDFEKVKNKLLSWGIWNLFVFPSIDWTEKGERVKEIIENMNLRAVNVLFVDDNINNLKEATFVVPQLQTTLPNNLRSLVEDEAFEGKDDTNHTRLAQYKILETKTEAKKTSASNEEFLYQSDIHVEMIDDCHNYLQRIYEMIHRNNQLNFTKDRIAQEDVNRIFTDDKICSGIVKVKDKFGDHGIIGCYAIENGKTLQFVFSCRILGMGVEQWVYAELGYPEVEIVGEVATKLQKNLRPGWINQAEKMENNNAEMTPSDFRKLLVYGTCPLRPIWAYLEPRLSNVKFADIDPAPPVCNLAVTIREDDKTKKEWLSKVHLFDAKFTFDEDIINEKNLYLLITLDREWDCIKYTSRITGKYFFSSMQLKDSTATKDILDDYSGSDITYNDIENELNYLMENLSDTVTVLLMTVPEVVFPSIGKDQNYNHRIQMNLIAEKLDAKYDNFHLIEMRKYAKTSADFFDLTSNHYNRSIGFSLAEDVISYMGANSSPKGFDPVHIVKSKHIIQIPEEIVLESYIVNGELVTKIKAANEEKFEFLFDYYRNRYLEYRSEWSSETIGKLKINKYGQWMVVVHVRDKLTGKQMAFKNKGIDYNDFSICMLTDPDGENYEEFTMGIPQLRNDYRRAEMLTQSMHKMISELSATGINFLEYFVDQSILELSLFIDKKNGEVILPFFKNAGIKINHIYSADACTYISSSFDMESVPITHINGRTLDELNKKDHVLFAYNGYQNLLFRQKFSKRKCIIHSLYFVLCSVVTKHFFKDILDSKKVPRILAVRTGSIARRNNGMPYIYVKASEKELDKLNETLLLNEIRKNKQLPQLLYSLDLNELQETLVRPTFIKDKNLQIQKMVDVQGEYLNIENGFRKTEGNPLEYMGTIYIIGDSTAFGCGVKDSETIASWLQKMIDKPYRVLNYSNCWNTDDYSEALNLIKKLHFHSNDIIVIIMPHWMHEKRTEVVGTRPHWLEWDALEEPVQKVDAFPIFAEADRPDYFLLPKNYNSAGNRRIAELIRDSIMRGE